MNKKISKILGLGLTAILLVSMLFSAIPVSADTLAWSSESGPSSSATKNVIATTSIADFAIASDGTTIYAADGTTNLFKSTNSGATWTKTTAPTNYPAAVFIAVAPDDPTFVVATTAAPGAVCFSTNGGTSFSTALPAFAGITTVTDIAIAPAVLGVRLILAAGNNGAASGALLEGFAYGTAFAWVNMYTQGASGATAVTDSILAVAVSPNYIGDKTIAVVSDDAAAGDYFEFGQVTTVTPLVTKWNTTGPFSTAVLLKAVAAASTKGSISMPGTFSGTDPTTRVCYAGIDAAVATNGGSYRITDNGAALVATSQLTTACDIYSVAVSAAGDKLIAGASLPGGTTSTVYSLASPATTSSKAVATTLYQGPGGVTGNVTVGWAGTTAVASSTGNEGAFASSTDYGVTFNDISFILTTVTTINDLVVKADGTSMYMVSCDAAPDTSVWRYDGAWVRIFSKLGDADWIVRVAPEDFNTVYLADTTGAAAALFYSNNPNTTWLSRPPPAVSIVDVAIESAQILYVASAGSVYKTTNGAFYFGAATDTTITALASIVSVGTDKVLVGGTGGEVAYSTNGNTTYTKPAATGAAGKVYLAASGLATNDYIYAVTALAGQSVYRFQIGGTTWTNMLGTGAVFAVGTEAGSGIRLSGGSLYLTTYDATPQSKLYRFANPSTAPSATTSAMDVVTQATRQFGSVVTALNGLQISVATTGNKIWAVTNEATDLIYSFTDTLSGDAAKPVLKTADKITVGMLVQSGAGFATPFIWSRVSLATKYQIQFSLDSAFTQVICDNAAVVQDTDFVTVLAGPTPLTNTATTCGVPWIPSTTFYWRVRVNGVGTGGATPFTSPWSVTQSVSVATATAPTAPVTPAPITLLSPAAGATTVSARPTFSWSAYPGATKYELQASLDTTFAVRWVARVGDTALPGTSWVSDRDFDPSTVYYWRVRPQLTATTFGPYTTGIFTTAGIPEPTQPAITPTFTVIPPAAAPTPAYIWAIIAIGAVLVIAVIILIVRTRRVP